MPQRAFTSLRKSLLLTQSVGGLEEFNRRLTEAVVPDPAAITYRK